MNQTIDTVRAVTNFLNWKKEKKPSDRSISATTSSSPQPSRDICHRFVPSSSWVLHFILLKFFNDSSVGLDRRPPLVFVTGRQILRHSTVNS
jgi:hypothetical protein